MGRSNGGQFGDTTYTKIFVGGLAWETKRETMKSYFEQFGEIEEAVVILDKYTGRSKGYGFVTFKDADSARRACEDPSPVIDGRRANCNLASLGAHKARTSTSQHGTVGYRPVHKSPNSTAPANLSSTYFHQPYQSPWYSVYMGRNIHPLNYYNVYDRNVLSTYYTRAGSEVYHNLPHYYTQYAPPGQGMQYYLQFPFVPKPHAPASGVVPPPPSAVAGERESGQVARKHQQSLTEEFNQEGIEREHGSK